MHEHLRHLIPLLALLGAPGCSGSPGLPTPIEADAGGKPAGDSGLSLTPPSSEPDFDAPAGAIRVTTWLALGETELTAFFADAPALRFHVESERIGQCRLMSYEPSTCTPGCAGSDACIERQCRRHPTRIDRGPIDWAWPGGQQTVSASDILSYHGVGEAHVAGDVNVSVAGINLGAPSDQPPMAVGDWAAAVAARGPSSDVTLRWSNPRPLARVRVRMTDCTGSHGGFAAAEIECEGADSGALVLPGSFLDRLAAGDWSHGECGVHTFERYFVSRPDADDSFRLETIAKADFFYRPR